MTSRCRPLSGSQYKGAVSEYEWAPLLEPETNREVTNNASLRSDLGGLAMTGGGAPFTNLCDVSINRPAAKSRDRVVDVTYCANFVSSNCCVDMQKK